MSNLKPKTIKEKEAYKRGGKHKAERTQHEFNHNVPNFTNPYTPQTMEFFFFNQGYLKA